MMHKFAKHCSTDVGTGHLQAVLLSMDLVRISQKLDHLKTLPFHEVIRG